MPPSVDAHVHLDVHPTHDHAVTAVLNGTQADIASASLEAAGWAVVTEDMLVLARIDREEPYWAQDAAKHLVSYGIAVDITPALQKKMDEEWTWANYPMSWCTRSEIREISDQAQQIHADILNGDLLIHAHAPDGDTTVAVGTYLTGSRKSVYLHGENHLRQIAGSFDSPAQALADFEKVHGAVMRPGPAPLTDTERSAIEASTSAGLIPAKPGPSRPQPEIVPLYLADPGDHEALLDDFLTEHPEFEKSRNWSDETTHAIHESQTLRIEYDHETQGTETAWTVAAYETPVSERVWVLTATASLPAPVLEGLLIHLGDLDAWDTPIDTWLTEKAVQAVFRPLHEAGWRSTAESPGHHWASPDGQAGIRYVPPTEQDPYAAATWTVWAGPRPHRPAWTITASPNTPSALLASLSEALAHETWTRQTQPAERQNRATLTTTPPTTPVLPANRPAGRSR
ncbi:DUF317 domain-containing protein [Streptomyces sp. NPDC001255]|uniref:DUF317 domain-containing protein n=1 Tax=Streptomyces sp. NPDC001255 TaxID=3364550 RepID=UPI00369CE980